VGVRPSDIHADLDRFPPLLLLQSSLNEVFNPRLRRGRAARKKAVKEGTELETPVEGDDAGSGVEAEAFSKRRSQLDGSANGHLGQMPRTFVGCITPKARM
jgi:hypothetical protein